MSDPLYRKMDRPKLTVHRMFQHSQHPGSSSVSSAASTLSRSPSMFSAKSFGSSVTSGSSREVWSLEAIYFETFGSPKVVRRKLGLVAGLSILLALLALPLSFFDNGASMDFAGRDDGCPASSPCLPCMMPKASPQEKQSTTPRRDRAVKGQLQST